ARLHELHEIEPAHARHGDVEHETIAFVTRIRAQEPLGRGKRTDSKAHGDEQAAEGLADRDVVVDDGDEGDRAQSWTDISSEISASSGANPIIPWYRGPTPSWHSPAPCFPSSFSGEGGLHRVHQRFLAERLDQKGDGARSHGLRLDLAVVAGGDE